jgi:hypothetical protein
LGLSIIYLQNKNKSVIMKFDEFLMIAVGSIVVMVSFLMDYLRFLNNKYSFYEILTYSWVSDINIIVEQYIPQKFNWLIFLIGILTIFVAIIKFILRNRPFFHYKTKSLK